MTDFDALVAEEAGMQWQAVDSSQIEAIGYESGAEYPLGIKFPPTKKQKAAGEPGSEYHYKNVAPELHAEFLAAKTNPDYDNSIGVFFGKVIKSQPLLYPFVKVEAENPPQPPSSPNGGGAPSTKNSTTSGKTSTTITEETTTDAPTGSSLAVIDKLDNTALFASGGVTDAQLAAGREWYLTEAKKYGIETEEKRTELKRFARPLQKLRTGIEARAKEFTGETKRALAAIDTEKRRLVLLVGGIEDEVLRPLIEWEREEDARKTRLSGEVKRLADLANTSHIDIPSMERTIAELESFDLSTMQEYKVGAESAIAASLRVLKPELERRKVAEANAAELAELRRKQAERDAQDRLAEQQRQDEKRIAEAAEKLAAEKIQAVVAETREQVLAEVAKAPAVENVVFSPEVTQLRPGFHSPAAVAGQQEYQAAEEVDPKENHRMVWVEAVEAFSRHLGLTSEDAEEIVSLIEDGQIPHVTINY